VARSRSFRSALTLGVLLVSCSTSSAGTPPDTGLTPNVTVRLYDYVGISARDLAGMETEAKRVLAKAGIPSTWLNCRPQNLQRSNPACRQPRTPRDIVLRIVSGDRAARKRFGFTGLGFSIVAGEGGFLATVMMSRVQQLAKQGVLSPGQILGFAAAHEVGHLLLNSTSHSLAGIMQAHWDTQALQRIAAGNLLFTDQEAELMKENLARRSIR